MRLAAGSRGDPGSTEAPTVQRQSWQQLSEAGDWIQTPALGCKSRCWAPSSPLLWFPLPVHRTGSFPVDRPPPSQELGFFNTDTLLTLLLLPPGWARLEEGDAQLEPRGGLKKHLCSPFWPQSPEKAAWCKCCSLPAGCYLLTLACWLCAPW